MKIEDMRIGGLYSLGDKVIKCIGLRKRVAHMAGHDDGNGGIAWDPCHDHRPVTARDLWPQAAALYTSPKQEPDTAPAERRGPQAGDKVERWSEVPRASLVRDVDGDVWHKYGEVNAKLVRSVSGGTVGIDSLGPVDGVYAPFQILVVGVTTPEMIDSLLGEDTAAK